MNALIKDFVAPGAAGEAPSQRPVFAFAMHRSGSTVLGRILNSHPDLVLWGEHAGVLNKFAEMDFIMRRNSILAAGDDASWLADYAGDADLRSQSFSPWTKAFNLDGFRGQARNVILSMFASTVQPQQRWGFKEIRYHTPLVAEYLAALFPAAQFILLRRDIIGLAISNILAAWSQDRLAGGGDMVPPAVAADVVRDVLYALLAVDTGFTAIEAALPGRCFCLDYRALAGRNIAAILLMLDFLELDAPAEVVGRIRAALDTPVNETRLTPAEGGRLTPNRIRRLGAELLPGIVADMAANGVDRGRLRARQGLGQYSFMAGDHECWDSPYSSMF